MSSCKLYGLKPKQIENLKNKLLNRSDGIKYDSKILNGENRDLNFYSEFEKKEGKYEFYNIEIDLFDKYYTRGVGETDFIYTIKVNIVLIVDEINEKQNTYLIAFMNKHLIKIFENIIDNLFKDGETLLKATFNLNKVKGEFTDYKKFALDKLNHNNLNKIYVSGTNLHKTSIYREYNLPNSFIGKIFVIHNHIYGVEIYYDGSFYIRQNLEFKKQSQIVLEIYKILDNGGLAKMSEWNYSILDFIKE